MRVAYQHFLMDTLGTEGELSVHALGKWRISTGRYHGDYSYKRSVVLPVLQHVEE